MCMASTKQQQHRSRYSLIHIDDDENLYHNIVEVPPPPSYANHVRFAATCDNVVHEIPHINDISDEEIDQVWYSFEEFEQMKFEVRKILKYIENEKNNNINKRTKKKKKNGMIRGLFVNNMPLLKMKKKRGPVLDEIDDLSCLRGLEEHSKSVINRKQTSNRVLLGTILSLQRLKKVTQIEQGITTNDVDIDKVIANVCHNYSSKDVDEAINVAKQDEIDATSAAI